MDLKQLEQKIDSAQTVYERIDAINSLAWELRDLDIKRGKTLAETAHHLAVENNYQKGIADGIVNLSHFIFRDYALALSLGYQSLTIYESLNDDAGKVRSLCTLCWAHWSLDNFVESIELGQQAHRLAQEIGDAGLEANALNNLGLAYKRSGNFELGIKVYSQALELYRKIGDPVRESKMLINIALAYVTQDLFEEALPYALESAKLQIGSTYINGYSNQVLGQIYAGLKNYDTALHYLNQSIYIAEERELDLLNIAALITIGEVYQGLEEYDLAVKHLNLAKAGAEKINSGLNLFRCHEILSQVYEKQGDFTNALAHFKQFHLLKEDVFNEKNANRLQVLQTLHQTEIAQQESKIYQLKNVELEKEINERQRLENDLRHLALTDELTGVHNRRFFFNQIHIEYEKANQKQLPLTIAILDLDYFKQINDTYGHGVGDQVLVNFARICQTKIRESDWFARFGGDEFVFLFPQTELQPAKTIIERIRQSLSAPILIQNGIPIILTLSVGMAALNSSHLTADALITQADLELYRAKEAGRDRVLGTN